MAGEIPPLAPSLPPPHRQPHTSHPSSLGLIPNTYDPRQSGVAQRFPLLYPHLMPHAQGSAPMVTQASSSDGSYPPVIPPRQESQDLLGVSDEEDSLQLHPSRDDDLDHSQAEQPTEEINEDLPPFSRSLWPNLPPMLRGRSGWRNTPSQGSQSSVHQS